MTYVPAVDSPAVVADPVEVAMPGGRLALAALGPARLLAGVPSGGPSLRAHVARHGGLPLPGLPWLIDAVEATGLRGRGGAGFPVAAKLRSMRQAPGSITAIVVNGSEGEPASWKDRVLMVHAPHLVLDGALVAANALQAQRVVVAVADERIAAILRQACAERADAATVQVAVRDGGFVGGEARALLRALDGGPQLPPGRRTLPTQHGLAGAPTFLSNVETFAQLAILARLGVGRFGAVAGGREAGTSLLTVSGAVRRMTVVETALGSSLRDIADAVGIIGRPSHVIIGGYHGAWLRYDPDLPVWWEGLHGVGGVLGAGVVVMVSDATCALGELVRAGHWLAEQSARRCGPCRSGLPALAGTIEAIGRGDGAAAQRARALGDLVSGRGACAHPDGAVRFLLSGLDVLGDEVERHLAHGGCGRPVLGLLPLTAARAAGGAA